jgi:ribokinase
MVKIAVIGSIVADLLMRTQRIPTVGENLQAEDFQIGPGGKGANAAVAVTKAGGEAILVGCAGNDNFWQMEQAFLQKEGVDIKSVAIDPSIHTGVAFIMLDAQGENTILVVSGANDRLEMEVVQNALKIHQSDFDGLLINFETPEPIVAYAIDTGKQMGIPVIVDAGPPRKYSIQTWSKCTVLSPNTIETETLVGYPIPSDGTARLAARDLLSAGPEAVVLKLGARGALLLTQDQELHIPSFEVDVVDTTGAGDAFSGTLAVGVIEGLPLEDAVLRANAAGALAVTRMGTMPAMPTRAEVDAFLAEHAEM